jgi:hypothetical protein
VHSRSRTLSRARRTQPCAAAEKAADSSAASGEETAAEGAEAVQAEEAGTERLATPPHQTSQQLPTMDEDAFPPTVEAFIQEYEVCFHSL